MNRLRIAMVAEAMDTGIAQIVYLLASGLDRRGHEVHLIHSVKRTDPDVMRRLRTGSGVRCTPIDMVRAVQPADAMAGLAIRRYLKRNGPFDIVHGHSSKGGALARLCSIGLPGVRIYSPHAFYTLSPDLAALPRFVYGTAERMLAHLCSAVICSSAIEKRHARTLGISAGRIAVIPNAIEPLALAPPARDQFGFPGNDAFIVGFVGRLEHQKAPDVLLKAVARAAAQNPAVRAVIIGDGRLQSSLKTLAATLGITDRIVWLGRQPAARYLASFDMLAMPSRYEGFSLMPLEAMHARLPIICTPVGGVEEAVVNGATGLVVPVEDCEAFGEAILALAHEPALRHAMGDAAQRRAQNFVADRMVAATERLYFEALDGKWPAEVFGRHDRTAKGIRPAREDVS